MKPQARLMRKGRKFGRCPIHGQGCEVAHEIRQPLTRADDRLDFQEDLELAAEEMDEGQD